MMVMPDNAQRHLGQYLVEHPNADGGTIVDQSNTSFQMFLNLLFVETDHRGQMMIMRRNQVIGLQENAPWSRMAPSLFDHGDHGNFFPGLPPNNNNDLSVNSPTTQSEPEALSLQGSELSLSWKLAQVPEPSSVILAALGLLGRAVNGNLVPHRRCRVISFSEP